MSPVKLFEQKKVRSHYDAEKEIWYFSVIDVIEILTGTDRSQEILERFKS